MQAFDFIMVSHSSPPYLCQHCHDLRMFTGRQNIEQIVNHWDRIIACVSHKMAKAAKYKHSPNITYTHRLSKASANHETMTDRDRHTETEKQTEIEILGSVCYPTITSESMGKVLKNIEGGCSLALCLRIPPSINLAHLVLLKTKHCKYIWFIFK